MAAKVILHIGQQKSGTTYLQGVLGHCADRLAAEAGILFPASMREVIPDTVENHERATYGLLGTEYPWVSLERTGEEGLKWVRLKEKVREWPDTVLISAEALSVIRRPAVQRFVDEFRPAEVEIVITTRGLGSQLPSLWQQHVRNGRGTSFPVYLKQLAEQRERGEEAVEEIPELHLWRAFSIGRLVRRWAAVAGQDRVTLVVNPGSPADMLWKRFTLAIGAPEHAGTPPAEVVNERSHSGLTLAEAHVLTALNKAIQDAGWSTYAARAIREEILLGALLPRADRGPKIAVPESAQAQVAQWSKEDLVDLQDTGVSIIGDIEELRYVAGRDPHPPATVEQVTNAAAAAIMAVASQGRFEPSPPPERQRFGRFRSRV